MGFMMLAWLVLVVVIGLLAVRMVGGRLPSAPTSDQDRRLAEQAEQIEQLEEELRRVKEQADFTEKLLSERRDDVRDRDAEKGDSEG